jgi:hypothetical protein
LRASSRSQGIGDVPASLRRDSVAGDDGVDDLGHLRLAQIRTDRIERSVVEVVRAIRCGVEEQGELLHLARQHGPIAAAGGSQTCSGGIGRTQAVVARHRSSKPLHVGSARLIGGEGHRPARIDRELDDLGGRFDRGGKRHHRIAGMIRRQQRGESVEAFLARRRDADMTRTTEQRQ